MARKAKRKNTEVKVEEITVELDTALLSEEDLENSGVKLGFFFSQSLLGIRIDWQSPSYTVQSI